jgi:glycosyltransferase involved in cell wall biosynthesis
MQISIVLACRNGAATLADALEGLTSQIWDGTWEIVFADNGSSDASAQIFEAHRRKNPKIPMRRVDAGARLGKSYALNQGIAAAEGEWLIFCDDDDVPGEGWLAAMARALASHEVVAAYLEYDRMNPAWVLEGNRKKPGALKGPQHSKYLPGCRVAGGGALGFHRSVLDRAGPFDETMLGHEDHDFCHRLHLAGFSIAEAPGAFMHVRLRSDFDRVYQQARKYALGRAVLASRYAPRPMTNARPWIELAVEFSRLFAALALISLGRAASRSRRAQLNKRLGTAVGDLVGALRCRIGPPPRSSSGRVSGELSASAKTRA